MGEVAQSLDDARQVNAVAHREGQVDGGQAGVALFELDPLGGLDGRDSYASLLRANAAVILQGLR